MKKHIQLTLIAPLYFFLLVEWSAWEACKNYSSNPRPILKALYVLFIALIFYIFAFI